MKRALNRLHLVVEIKGYRKEDANEKKATMEAMCIPGVNHHLRFGRWAFTEFIDVYMIEPDFKAKVEGEFEKLVPSTPHMDQGTVRTGGLP